MVCLAQRCNSPALSAEPIADDFILVTLRPGCLRVSGVFVREAEECGQQWYVIRETNGPAEDRERCEFVESLGVKALPMWFHRLDAMRRNEVTEAQRAMGWTARKRRELMCWYYWHRTLDTRG